MNKYIQKPIIVAACVLSQVELCQAENTELLKCAETFINNVRSNISTPYNNNMQMQQAQYDLAKELLDCANSFANNLQKKLETQASVERSIKQLIEDKESMSQNYDDESLRERLSRLLQIKTEQMASKKESVSNHTKDSLISNAELFAQKLNLSLKNSMQLINNLQDVKNTCDSVTNKLNIQHENTHKAIDLAKDQFDKTLRQYRPDQKKIDQMEKQTDAIVTKMTEFADQCDKKQKENLWKMKKLEKQIDDMINNHIQASEFAQAVQNSKDIDESKKQSIKKAFDVCQMPYKARCHEMLSAVMQSKTSADRYKYQRKQLPNLIEDNNNYKYVVDTQRKQLSTVFGTIQRYFSVFFR